LAAPLAAEIPIVEAYRKLCNEAAAEVLRARCG
jgi:hypothetical protein